MLNLRSLQGAHDGRNERAAYQDRPDSRHPEEGLPFEEAPDFAPEGSELPPVFQTLARLVIADDMVLGTIVFSNDGEQFHVDPSGLKLLDGGFGIGVRIVDSYG